MNNICKFYCKKIILMLLELVIFTVIVYCVLDIIIK